MPIIDVTDLKKTYVKRRWRFWAETERTAALRGVSFSVDAGEMFGIVGPNGAGKTTLINILSGLLYKDSGSVEIFGKEVHRHREELAERMNVATAYSKLSGNLTVEENLRVFARIYDVDDAADRIDTLLHRFEIAALRDKKVYHLSAGQKTRANLCKSFINRPDILLLDEATAGLDPHIAATTREAIQDLNDRFDTTIVLTSHNMEDIDTLSDRMLFLHNGKVLREGTPRTLKEQVHVKVLTVTVDATTAAFEQVVSDVGGEVDRSTATIPIESEDEIITVLDRISDLDVTILDIEARNPDLNKVFKDVARQHP